MPGGARFGRIHRPLGEDRVRPETVAKEIEPHHDTHDGDTGHGAYHQYWRPLSAPCLIIAPHSAVGGTAPRPIKLKPRSARWRSRHRAWP